MRRMPPSILILILIVLLISLPLQLLKIKNSKLNADGSEPRAPLLHAGEPVEVTKLTPLCHNEVAVFVDGTAVR